MRHTLERDLVQERYARWLQVGTRTGLALIVLGLAVYVTEMVAPHVPIERLPELWGLSADRYLEAARIAPGWGWAALAHRADLMSLAGLALLAGCSVLPLAAGLLAFYRRGERAQAAVCALQVAVLIAAASGLIGAGH